MYVSCIKSSLLYRILGSLKMKFIGLIAVILVCTFAGRSRTEPINGELTDPLYRLENGRSKERLRRRAEFMRDFPLASFTSIFVKGPNRLPLLLKATITYYHLPDNNPNPAERRRRPIPSFIYRRMSQTMNKLEGDDAGHLLACSLGGGSDNEFNYAPQTNRANRNFGGDYALWINIERSIKSYLDHPGKRVDWTLIVIYDTDLPTNRPIGFQLRHLNYDRNILTNPTENTWCFSNDGSAELMFQSSVDQ